MSDLTQDSLERTLADLVDMIAKKEEQIAMRPTHIIVPQSMLKQALKVMYYKPPIRRASGARKRKLALYWR